MNNQPHLVRLALHNYINYLQDYRTKLVDFLIANKSERYYFDKEQCESLPIFEREKTNILAEIRSLNTQINLLHNYDNHIMLMVESGSVIKSFDEWLKENRKPEPTDTVTQKLDDIKSGKCCLFDNLTTASGKPRRFLEDVFRRVDANGNFKSIGASDKYFLYNKHSGLWRGYKDYAINLCIVRLTDVMHFKQV